MLVRIGAGMKHSISMERPCHCSRPHGVSPWTLAFEA